MVNQNSREKSGQNKNWRGEKKNKKNTDYQKFPE